MFIYRSGPPPCHTSLHCQSTCCAINGRYFWRPSTVRCVEVVIWAVSRQGQGRQGEESRSVEDQGGRCVVGSHLPRKLSRFESNPSMPPRQPEVFCSCIPPPPPQLTSSTKTARCDCHHKHHDCRHISSVYFQLAGGVQCIQRPAITCRRPASACRPTFETHLVQA